MSNYPKKTCEIDRLVRHPKSVSQAKAEQKTQQRRDGVYGYPGETFELDGVSFTLKDLQQQKLGEMTDAEAQAEGYPDLSDYKKLILQMHPGMDWNENHLVWVHYFQRNH